LLEIPIGRLGTPDEIADTILWMIKTGYVTNKVIAVDGGRKRRVTAYYDLLRLMGQSAYLQYIMTTQIISEHLLNDSGQRIARKCIFPIRSVSLQRPLQSRRLKLLRH
jgi:hypothetical protein